MESRGNDSPAMREAQVKLREAIDECIRATGLANEMVTTSWVLYGHQAGFEDGKSLNGYFLLTGPSNDQPHHVTLGLMYKALHEQSFDE